MPYTKTNWQDNETPLSALNMNKIEQGIADAHSAIDSHAARTDNPHNTTAAQVGAVSKTGDTMTGDLSIQSRWPAVWLIDTDINNKISILHDNSAFYVQLRDAAGNWIRDLLMLTDDGAVAKLGTNNIWHAGNLRYEEGAWTPELRFGGSSTGITYDVNVARYTRIGNMIFIDAIVALTSKGTATGNAVIAGLPFRPKSLMKSWGNIAPTNITFPSGKSALIIGVDEGGFVIGLLAYGSGSGYTSLTDANFSNSSVLELSLAYII